MTRRVSADRSAESAVGRSRSPGGAGSPPPATTSLTSSTTEAPDDLASGRPVRSAAKRVVDMVGGAVVLLTTLPLMMLIALAIVMESRGPLVYYAERVGRGGERFRMLKFRKMQPDAEGPRLTVAQDRRLTRVGAFLTRTKLDELPQFWNVVRGDMSLIGPRPEDPGFVAQRSEDYAVILRVRPGVTGFSQLAFANENRILSKADPVTHYLDRIFPQKCGLDRMYVERLSLRTDLRILAWTLIAVLLRRPVAVDRCTGEMRLRRR